MQATLSFNGVTLTPIPHHHSIWIRATELAHALGYSDESSVGKIYRRNADEFTPEMTQLIEISDSVNLTVQTRIFSLRGCHLLAMFARTPVAKDFRKWVLDVLDKYNAEQQAALPPEDAPITPADQSVLQAIIRAKVEAIPADKRGKGLYPQIWSRFNNHFRLGSYKQLPQCRMADAVTYLTQMELRAKALPAAAPTRPRAAGDEERYLRFLERLEKTRRLINEHSSELCLEAARLLPKELLQKKQFGNALGWLIRWIMEEITSPTPRGGLLRDDNDSPLYILMQYGK